ncbi:MAG TPA: class I SAM-dependent methyltransferase, partial [Gemmataceae bacterium]
TALDFGCGAGRLTQALARHYEKVIGVDISLPMLETARRLDRSGGRCLFVHNSRPDLANIPDASVDLVFTSLVLQHIPPDIAETYLREFGRVLRPGGSLVVLMPAATRATIPGLVFRYAPPSVVGLLQKHILRYPAPMRMHTLPSPRMHAILGEAGMVVLGSTDETGYGDHWRFVRYYAIRPAIPSQAEPGGAIPAQQTISREKADVRDGEGRAAQTPAAPPQEAQEEQEEQRQKTS